jgi:hypothetical protein
MRDYMHDYRARESEKQAQKDAWMKEVGSVLKEELIGSLMADGKSREQAEGYFDEYCTPPELREEEEEESQSVEAASDSVSEEKPCTAYLGKSCPNFGKEFHKDSDPCQRTCTVKDDCYHAWFEESHKPQAVKDAERNAKTIAYLAESKARQKKDELQDLIEIGAAIQAGKDARQEQLDALTQKYMDRGIDQGTAEKDAEWELKQEEQFRIRKSNEIQMIWNELPENEQFNYKLKLWRDNKKLLEGKK